MASHDPVTRRALLRTGLLTIAGAGLLAACGNNGSASSGSSSSAGSTSLSASSSAAPSSSAASTSSSAAASSTMSGSSSASSTMSGSSSAAMSTSSATSTSGSAAATTSTSSGSAAASTSGSASVVQPVPETPVPTVSGKATIRFSGWGSTQEIDIYKKVVANFNSSHHNINVVYQPIPTDYGTKILTELAGGTAPDVGYVNDTDFPAWYSKGALKDITGEIETQKVNLDDFYPEVLNYFQVNGRYYGLTKDFTTFVVYYNKDLFQKANVQPPQSWWTWNDFVDAAKKLDKGNTQPGYAPDSTNEAYWNSWVGSNGGSIMNDPLAPTKCVLNDQAAVGGLQFFADLWLKHNGAASPVTNALGQGASDAFVGGRVAMVTYGRWEVPTYKDIKNFKWDVTYFPQNKQKYSTMFATCLSAFKDTKDLAAAAAFIGFLAGTPQGQSEAAKLGLAIPAIKSVANSPSFKLPDVPINHDIYLNEIPYGRLEPRTPAFAEVSKVWDSKLDPVWRGNQTAQDATNGFVPQIDSILGQNPPIK